MRYCQRCILPDTRPNLHIEADGICNACHSQETKKEIDWAAREAAFQDVVAHAKEKSTGYDCVIPVSGGKDSTWQVVTCLKYGLKPLAVTWRPPGRTAIGQRNLQNLIALGVDHIDYQINPEVEKRFMLKTLQRFGSNAIPMHLALFNIPLNIAWRFDIPLVVWGENSAFEYGSASEAHTGFRLDETWLRNYGVTHGTTAADWVDDMLSAQALYPYTGPTTAQLDAKHINAVFLGYYFRWDVANSLRVAEEHGFQRAKAPKVGYYNYADIDDNFISIHHYLKWYKFGFTRLFDNLSQEIRHQRMAREDALNILRAMGDQHPHDDIAMFCEFVGISKQAFYDIIEVFRNHAIWKYENGVWYIPNFIIPDWKWSD